MQINHDAVGMILITVPNPAATIAGADTPCSWATVMQRSGTQAYMNIDAAATTSHWKLSANLVEPLTFPISNLNRLNIIGTAGDIVQVLYGI